MGRSLGTPTHFFLETPGSSPLRFGVKPKPIDERKTPTNMPFAFPARTD